MSVLFDIYPLNLLVCLAIAIPLLIWNDVQAPSARTWARLTIVAAVLAIAIAGLLFSAQLPYSPQMTWSGCRLAPAMGWLQGYRLYYPVDEGPVMVQMYGPISAMVYAPAALGTTPTAAMMIGTIVNLLLYLLPPLLFFLRVHRQTPRAYLVIGIGVFLIVSARQGVLSEAATRVTIDAPAVSFCALAMVVLASGKMKSTMRSGLICGCLVALGAWSKLTVAPVAIAVVVYSLLICTMRDAIRFFISMTIAGLTISGMLVAWFGTELLVQNIVIPARQPWQWPSDSATIGYGKAILALLRYSQPSIWIALLAAVLFVPRSRIWNRQSMQKWASENPWVLPLIAAITVLPTASLAAVKIGGSYNNAVAISYFALLAGASALAGGAASLVIPSSGDALCQRLANVLLIALCLGGCWLTGSMWKQVGEGLKTWAHLDENGHEQGYRYALKHPGEAWFPSYPLSTLLAEGQLYHLAAGLDSAEWGGYPVSDEHLRKWLPSDLRAIFYHPDFPEHVLARLSEFNHTTSDPEMPGWAVRLRHNP